jgi:alcohol dehydrogenase
MHSFDFQPRTRVVFGPDTIDRLGSLIAEWNARHVLIVTDEHIVKAGHAPRALKSIEAAGIRVTLYDAVRQNPTTEDVDRCLAVARRAGIDTIVGLGGGSSLDTAKGANFILTNGGTMHDYWGVGKAKKPMLPLVAVPTTAGTGSECQSFALIADAKTHMKMACGDPKAAPRIALLDPTLTLSMPRNVTADTGIDTIAHAVETAVTNKRSALSLVFSREAFRLACVAFPRVLQKPDDLEARGKMLLAAAWAGTAIENSMLGAAHSAANPLTAHFNIVHGKAVGLMLPSVVRFNGQDPVARQLYAELAMHARLVGPDVDAADAVDTLADTLESLLDAAAFPAGLSDYSIPRDMLPVMAAEAAKQWTANFNPRPLTPADFTSLYEAALTRRIPAA